MPGPMPEGTHLRPPPPAVDGAGAPSGSLATILDRLASEEPDAVFLRDAEGRETWSGRPARIYTRAAAAGAVRRLSSRLLGLGLTPESPIAICLPGGTEACLVILAAELAGLIPVLVPLHGEAGELAELIDRAAVRAVVTQARVGSLAPAALFRDIARRQFRVRFLLAFGPDLPEGVIDLEPGGASAATSGCRGAYPGLVTFGQTGEAFLRGSSSWLAAAALVLAATRWGPRDTIVSCLAPDDLKGLATGPIACLASGAACELHGVFDPRRLAASLGRHERRHVVLPGWTERLVGPLGLSRAASIAFVHSSLDEVPSRGVPEAAGLRVTDVVALGEAAILAAERSAEGRPALRLEGSHTGGLPRELLAVRTGENGALEIRGLAAAAAPYPAGAASPSAAAHTVWRPAPLARSPKRFVNRPSAQQA